MRMFSCRAASTMPRLSRQPSRQPTTGATPGGRQPTSELPTSSHCDGVGLASQVSRRRQNDFRALYFAAGELVIAALISLRPANRNAVIAGSSCRRRQLESHRWRTDYHVGHARWRACAHDAKPRRRRRATVRTKPYRGRPPPR